jgi:hypothetical protein
MKETSWRVVALMLNARHLIMRFINGVNHPVDCFFCAKPVRLLLLACVFVVGCSQDCYQKGKGFALQEGDLLFQDLDCGPLCDAIEKVTTGYRGAGFSHVGIAAKDADGSFVVIESSSSGVTSTPLQTFLNSSLDTQGRPKVVVGRLKPVFRRLIPLAIKEAVALKGNPYDRVFAINNDSFYCSELIYEIFLRANNDRPVFALQPMTFKDLDTGTTLPAWEQYFSELGVSVPEGEPGINPGGISCSPVLSIIYSYGIPNGW